MHSLEKETQIVRNCSLNSSIKVSCLNISAADVSSVRNVLVATFGWEPQLSENAEKYFEV